MNRFESLMRVFMFKDATAEGKLTRNVADSSFGVIDGYGSKRIRTDQGDSTNNLWVALLTVGEGSHNKPVS